MMTTIDPYGAILNRLANRIANVERLVANNAQVDTTLVDGGVGTQSHVATFYQAAAPTGLNMSTDVGMEWVNSSTQAISWWDGFSWQSGSSPYSVRADSGALGPAALVRGRTSIEFTTATTAPVSPTTCDIWHDTTAQAWKQWQGASWVTFTDANILNSLSTQAPPTVTTSCTIFFMSDSRAVYAWTGTVNNSASTETSDLGVRTNLAYSPGMEDAGTTGGFIANAGTTASKDTTIKWQGTKSAKFVTTTENWGYYPMDGSTNSGVTSPTHTVGQQYTASIYVYAATAQNLCLLDYGTGNTKGPTVAVPANTWTRLSVSFIAGTNVFLSVRDPNRVNVVGTIYLDGFLLEVDGTVRNYFDGSTTISGPSTPAQGDLWWNTYDWTERVYQAGIWYQLYNPGVDLTTSDLDGSVITSGTFRTGAPPASRLEIGDDQALNDFIKFFTANAAAFSAIQGNGGNLELLTGNVTGGSGGVGAATAVAALGSEASTNSGDSYITLTAASISLNGRVKWTSPQPSINRTKTTNQNLTSGGGAQTITWTTGFTSDVDLTITSGLVTVHTAGWYLIRATLVWGLVNTTGRREITIWLNQGAGGFEVNKRNDLATNLSSVLPSQDVIWMGRLNVGDVFWISANQTAGVNTEGIVNDVHNYFQAYQLGF